MEKCLRFEAEHKLSRLEESGHSSNLVGLSRLKDDIPISEPNSTEILFSAQLDPLEQQLERIQGLGIEERWLLRAEDLQLESSKILGHGGFGIVLAAEFYGTPVAVKILREPLAGDSAKHLADISNELRIMRRVRHPNIIAFHGACIEPSSGELSLVLERVIGKPLDRFVTGPCSTAQAPTRCGILIDVACALRYLHAQVPAIVHGDLKASNILVEIQASRARAKLIDFGLSRLITRRAHPLGGTARWMAPETLSQPATKPATSADVYACGLAAFFLIAGSPPFSAIRRRQIVKLTQRGRAVPLDWPHWCPFKDECTRLVNKCLHPDARHRPCIFDVHTELLTWGDSVTRRADTSLKDSIRKARQAVARVSNNLAKERNSADWTDSSLTSGSSAGCDDLQSQDLADDSCSSELTASCSGRQILSLPLVAVPENMPLAASDCALATSRQALTRCGLVETPASSKCHSLIRLLMQWSVAGTVGECCPLHARMAEARRHIRSLAQSPCQRDFNSRIESIATWQCPECGLLDTGMVFEDLPICHSCGYQKPAATTDLKGNQAIIEAPTDATVPCSRICL